MTNVEARNQSCGVFLRALCFVIPSTFVIRI